MNKTIKKLSIKDITIVGMCIATISIASQIVIPVGIVPFTLQVFALSIVSFSLSRKQAMYSVILYIIMGLIGFPIFSYAKGGIALLQAPTFGFILGFIPFVFILNTFKNKYLAIILAHIVLYILGLSFLALYYIKAGEIVTFQLLLASWLPFLPTDLIGMYLASKIANRLTTSVYKK